MALPIDHVRGERIELPGQVGIDVVDLAAGDLAEIQPVLLVLARRGAGFGPFVERRELKLDAVDRSVIGKLGPQAVNAGARRGQRGAELGDSGEAAAHALPKAFLNSSFAASRVRLRAAGRFLPARLR